MSAISRISHVIDSNSAQSVVKNAKKALPVVGGLGVLAGSSLGGGSENFYHVAPPSGASVTDPFLDQLSYTGELIANNVSDMVHAIGVGVSDLTDGASDLADKALDFAGNILDTLG